MPLKSAVDNLDGLDKALHPLYEKGQDNRYYLSVEGMVPNERLVEFRNNNVELKKQLEKFEGIDPEKYRTLSKREKEIMEGKLIEQGKVDEVVAERVKGLKTEYDGKLTDLTKQNTTLTGKLSSVLIDSTVKSAAIALGVLPTAVDDVVLRAKAVFQVRDGEAVAVNDRGDVVYGSDPTKPLSIDEWVKQLKGKAGHLFEGMRGSGAPGNNRGPGGTDTSKMSATQKIAAGLAAQSGG